MPKMNSKLFVAVLAAGAAVCQAQEDPNRFGLGFRMGFNLDAKFKESGGGTSSLIGPPVGGGIDRTYDDGFVRRDSSGNQGGLTWNWGYQDASQVVGTELLLHATGATAVPGFSSDDDPQFGGELVYQRRLGQWSWGRWGLLAAFNLTDVQIDASHRAPVDAFRVTDAYSTGGIVLPGSPYAGSFAGPGPVISDSPVRTTETLSGVVESTRRVDLQLYGWRLGPYLELPVSERFSVGLGGGLALGYADGEFAYRDVTTVGGVSGTRQGSASDGEFLAGGYAEAQLVLRLSRRLGVFTAAQYQHLPDFEQSAQGTRVELGLGNSVFLSLGATVTF